MRKLKLLCFVVVVLAALWLGFWIVSDNSEAISVRFFGMEVNSVPTGIWLLGTFGFGAICGLIPNWFQVAKLKRQLKRLNRRLLKSGQVSS